MWNKLKSAAAKLRHQDDEQRTGKRGRASKGMAAKRQKIEERLADAWDRGARVFAKRTHHVQTSFDFD